jgi:hypothetical protein
VKRSNLANTINGADNLPNSNNNNYYDDNNDSEIFPNKTICRTSTTAQPASDICGRVFLTKPNERGEVKRARVVELIKDFEGKVSKDKDLIKFKLKYDHSDLKDLGLC